MQAVLVQQADLAFQGAEDHQILPQDTDDFRPLADAFGHRDGMPEPAHVFTARRAGLHMGQFLILSREFGEVVSVVGLVYPAGFSGHGDWLKEFRLIITKTFLNHYLNVGLLCIMP